MKTTAKIPAAGTKVRLSARLEGSADVSFAGRVGTITAVHPECENYSENFTVTLPNGRHDMFFADEFTVTS